MSRYKILDQHILGLQSSDWAILKVGDLPTICVRSETFTSALPTARHWSKNKDLPKSGPIFAAMFEFISVMSASSALFLSFLVLALRPGANRMANRWLAAFLCSLALMMFEEGLYQFGVFAKNPWLIEVMGIPVFAITPMLFLSVSHFVSVNKGWKWVNLWHFLPFLVHFSCNVPFFLLSNAEKKAMLETASGIPETTDWLFMAAVWGQFLAYQFLAFRKLVRHRKNIENLTAAPAETRLDWLFYFLIGLFVMTLTWIVCTVGFQFSASPLWENLVYFVGVYLLGYFALRQREVFPFPKNSMAEVGQILDESENPPSRRTHLAPEKLDGLKTRLSQKMATEKPFLDPELTLPTLAERMGLTLHEMSELVNVGFGENFSQFVNRHRIEESQRMLTAPEQAHLSIVGIAFEAGFNSKTAFNTAFKKMTGRSPSEFRREKN